VGAREVVACCGQLLQARTAEYVRDHGIRLVGYHRFAARTIELLDDLPAMAANWGSSAHHGLRSSPMGAPPFLRASTFEALVTLPWVADRA
jgi:hypothetical protein